MNKQKRVPFLTTAFAVILIAGMLGCEKSEGIVSSEDRLTSVTAEVIDMELAHSIKVALATEAALVDADISVIVNNGEVQLRGMVDNQDQHTRAVEIASGVAGVNRVDDRLAVKEQK